jgi:NitT/TauT family transport system permease protein
LDDAEVLVSLKARRRRARVAVHLWRAAIVLAALGMWQAASGTLLDPRWFSNPVEITVALGRDLASGVFWGHLRVTLTEMAAGFAIGVPLGAIGGLAYGRARRLGRIAHPLVIGIYSIPLAALSPLFILWFGLGILAKAVLVAVTVFWLIFFNVAAGVGQVDPELVAAIRQLGGRRIDEWHLVILPSVAEWFFAGVKLAVPYALVGAVVAEMVASSEGLGYLATRAASFLRMDALYAVVIVLGILGVLLNGIAEWTEAHFGRWQPNRQVRL